MIKLIEMFKNYDKISDREFVLLVIKSIALIYACIIIIGTIIYVITSIIYGTSELEDLYNLAMKDLNRTVYIPSGY